MRKFPATVMLSLSFIFLCSCAKHPLPILADGVAADDIDLADLRIADRSIMKQKMLKADKIVKNLEATVQRNPNNPVEHFNLGNAYFHLGWEQKAIAEYNEAIRLKPNYPEAHNNLKEAVAKDAFRKEIIRRSP